MNIIIKFHIKNIRMQKKISVRDLAALTGLSKTHISDIENNHKMPTIYTLCLIAIALEVNPEELYEYNIVKK